MSVKHAILAAFAALFASAATAEIAPELRTGMAQCRPHWRKINNVSESHWDVGWEHCQAILVKYNEAEQADARANASAQEQAAQDATKALADKLNSAQ